MSQATTQSGPRNVQAEQHVLGSLLRDGDLMLTLPPLDAEDFCIEPHRHVFAAIRAVVDANRPVDVVTVGEQLMAGKTLEMIGGPTFLDDLMREVGTTVGIEHHATIVRQHAQRRRYMQAGADIAAKATDPEASVSDLQAWAESAVLDVSMRDVAGKSGHTGMELAEGAVTHLRTVIDGGVIPGAPTGFDQLDRITLGLHRTDLLILAGRPGMGKTAFALALIANIAAGNGGTAAMFSLEMGAEQLAMRLIAGHSRLNVQRLRDPRQLSADERGRFMRSAEWLSTLPVWVDDTPGIKLSDMRTKLRRLSRRERVALVVVDYLQLMGARDPKMPREQQISEMSRGFKGLAKEFDVPVVALSQLNRSVEQRADKRPQLSDLRESGAIEQDADVIMFVYRDEYYHPDSDDKGIAEIIVGKQRNGPTDTARVAFIATHAGFGNLTEGFR